MHAYHLALEMTILLAFWLCLGVLARHRRTPGRLTFAAVTVSVSLWCLGEMLHGGDGLPDTWVDRIRVAGAMTLPAFWVGLAAHATRTELARRVPWFPAILLLPLTVPYALLFVDGWSQLVLKSVPGGIDEFGPLLWVVMAYSYGLALAGCVLFVVDAWRARGAPRWYRQAACAVGALLPLAGNAFFVMRGFSDPVDPTPVLFGAGLVALRGALFSGSLLQALPISQHDLIEQLPIGVLLTDTRGAVIDMNPAAELHLGVDEASAVGRNLEAVLAETDAEVQADVAPIYAQGKEVGQLVLFDSRKGE